MTRRRWMIATMLVVLLIAAAIPYPTSASPAIEVRIVDGDGKPVEGTRVERYWFSHDRQRPNWRISDAAGTCRFPREYVRRSAASRLLFHLKWFLLGRLPTPFGGKAADATIVEVLYDKQSFKNGHVEDCGGNRLNLPTTGHSPGVSLSFRGTGDDRCFHIVLKSK